MTQQHYQSDIEADPANDEIVYVVGQNPLGRAVASQLAARGTAVTHFDRSVLKDPPPGHATEPVDPGADGPVSAASTDPAVTLVVGPTDSQNLLLTQHVRAQFDTGTVVVVVNDPECAVAFEGLGVETIETSQVLADALTEFI